LKPVIEHYPNEYANSFEKMGRGEWFDQAYQYFSNYFRLPDFQRICKKEHQELNIPKMEKVTKEQLIHKFRGDIVASLINDKEEPAACSWLIEPKIIIQQRVWKEMNPRSAMIRTLQEELSMTYNKMDFLKDHQDPPSALTPRYDKEPFPRPTNKSQKLIRHDDDPENARDLERSMNIREHIEEQELKLVEKVWAGEIILDDDIEKNVEDLYTLVSEDVLRDTFMVENFITEVDIVNELKRIEVNLASQNFIANGEELSSEVIVYRRDQPPELMLKAQKHQEPKRKEMAR
jgi:hypothetical protein